MGEQGREGFVRKGGDSSALHGAPPLQAFQSLPMNTAQPLAVGVAGCLVACAYTLLRSPPRAPAVRCGAGQSEKSRRMVFSFFAFRLFHLSPLRRWEKGGWSVASLSCCTSR